MANSARVASSVPKASRSPSVMAAVVASRIVVAARRCSSFGALAIQPSIRGRNVFRATMNAGSSAASLPALSTSASNRQNGVFALGEATVLDVADATVDEVDVAVRLVVLEVGVDVVATDGPPVLTGVAVAPVSVVAMDDVDSFA